MYRKMEGVPTQNIIKDVKAPTVMCGWPGIVYSSFPSRIYRPNDKKKRKGKCEMKTLVSQRGSLGRCWYWHSHIQENEDACVAVRTSFEIPADLRRQVGRGVVLRKQDTHRTLAGHWDLHKDIGCLFYWDQTNPGIILLSVSGAGDVSIKGNVPTK